MQKEREKEMMELDIPAPRGIDSKTWENFQKIFNNEMAWYEKHPPFESQTGNNWRLFFSLFHCFRIVRRFIGGTWVRGEFGLWMKTTEHFPKECLAKHPHETW